MREVDLGLGVGDDIRHVRQWGPVRRGACAGRRAVRRRTLRRCPAHWARSRAGARQVGLDARYASRGRRGRRVCARMLSPSVRRVTSRSLGRCSLWHSGCRGPELALGRFVLRPSRVCALGRRPVVPGPCRPAPRLGRPRSFCGKRRRGGLCPAPWRGLVLRLATQHVRRGRRPRDRRLAGRGLHARRCRIRGRPRPRMCLRMRRRARGHRARTFLGVRTRGGLLGRMCAWGLPGWTCGRRRATRVARGRDSRTHRHSAVWSGWVV